jgi:hypothetical protein
MGELAESAGGPGWVGLSAAPVGGQRAGRPAGSWRSVMIVPLGEAGEFGPQCFGLLVVAGPV